MQAITKGHVFLELVAGREEWSKKVNPTLGRQNGIVVVRSEERGIKNHLLTDLTKVF